jgi:hypothetical protein
LVHKGHKVLKVLWGPKELKALREDKGLKV